MVDVAASTVTDNTVRRSTPALACSGSLRCKCCCLEYNNFASVKSSLISTLKFKTNQFQQREEANWKLIRRLAVNQYRRLVDVNGQRQAHVVIPPYSCRDPCYREALPIDLSKATKLTPFPSWSGTPDTFRVSLSVSHRAIRRLARSAG